MNFFASVFADDPDPPSPESESESEFESANTKHPPQQEQNPDAASSSNPGPSAGSGTGAWSFGGLIKTLTTKSESVLETYRRDLKEFGSGLKKELEVAQGSLGTVSTVIDEFGNTVLKSTAQIKDAILAADHESDSSESNNYNNQNNSGQQRRYNRFDTQLRAIQRNVNTYCEEVDDLDDYKKWKSGFVLGDVNEIMEKLLAENGAMDNIYKTVVPNNVDHETFWCRYFYRVFKLKQAEDLRASLVKRAISREEEELSWDVDDDDDDENVSASNVVEKALNSKEIEDMDGRSSGEIASEEVPATLKNDLSKNKELADDESEKILKEESLQGNEEGEKIAKYNMDDEAPNGDSVMTEKVGTEKRNDKMNMENSSLKLEEKVTSMGTAEPGESSKDSDFSVVSSQPPVPDEEDLGWDEIEDLSSIEEKKVTQGGSPNRAELRKRLSAAEEEEDLSWDIEDDDDLVKA